MVQSKFQEMYIWHHTPRRQEFLPPWGTALRVAPTVRCTARWSQIHAVVGYGGRNPSAVGHCIRSPSAEPHGGRVLAPWATAAGRQRPLIKPLPPPAPSLSLHSPPSLLSTFGFQPFGALLSEVCF
jgi:hypothetical protein